jgi:hypothetical protein
MLDWPNRGTDGPTSFLTLPLLADPQLGLFEPHSWFYLGEPHALPLSIRLCDSGSSQLTQPDEG